VAALDFTGHGASTVPVGGGYTAELLLADADLAVAHLGTATVVGRGVGAYVALMLAGARTERVHGVVLADGPGLSGGASVPTSQTVVTFAPASGAPDPYALLELGRDLRPPDYATTFARFAIQASPLDAPITVVARFRPQWLAAVADELGVAEADSVEGALAPYAAASPHRTELTVGAQRRSATRPATISALRSTDGMPPPGWAEPADEVEAVDRPDVGRARERGLHTVRRRAVERSADRPVAGVEVGRHQGARELDPVAELDAPLGEPVEHGGRHQLAVDARGGRQVHEEVPALGPRRGHRGVGARRHHADDRGVDRRQAALQPLVLRPVAEREPHVAVGDAFGMTAHTGADHEAAERPAGAVERPRPLGMRQQLGVEVSGVDAGDHHLGRFAPAVGQLDNR
jgi:pimeloyl-ACP methyl ester carboxylesterase